MPTRPSLYSLAGDCRAAENLIASIGSEWKHYRGDVYMVTGYGIDEPTGEVAIQYTPAYSGESPRGLDGLTFHRPASEWKEIIAVHAGDLLTPDETDHMTPEEKLAVANEYTSIQRFRPVIRVEHFEVA